jgi:lipopolysaccharide/colanic/teichoic acid biosynthesis glycosyltransferase
MRVLDVSLSLAGLIILSPVFVAVALAVKGSSRGPVLYRAQRVGRYGRLFTLYKFRSMYVDHRGDGPRITGREDTRVTAVGRFLRRTKLDELPQLFNTLIGEMSLVGPRPEDPVFVSCYSEAEREVLRVKPGITSLATLLHRHEEELLTGANFEERYRREIMPAKLRIELQYLSNRTLATDLRILAATAVALFRKPPYIVSCKGL